MLNIVCGDSLVNYFKMSNYFRQNLGLVATVDKNGRRVFNDKDKFSYYYNNLYKTTIYAKGNIGNIKIYTDFYIKDDVIAIYYNDNFEEFIFNLDKKLVREKGMDFYLGHLIKQVEEEYQLRKEKQELKKTEEKPLGDPTKVFTNPGQVSYEDLKAYLEEKRKNRINL
jgi:hypothetical protein